jgi:hypothetical protein
MASLEPAAGQVTVRSPVVVDFHQMDSRGDAA